MRACKTVVNRGRITKATLTNQQRGPGFALPEVTVVNLWCRDSFTTSDWTMATFGVARVQNVSRRARLIGLVLAALISGIYATWFAQRPLYNWDMIPYVAIALLDAGQPADTLREKTYDIIKESTPVERHEFLLGGSNYKKDTYIRGADYRYMVARDSKIFANQLPFYTVKPVYPALMSLFVRAGVNPVTATMVISGAAYAAICLLLYVWISRWLNPAISLVITALLSLNPILTPLAQLATPDALSVFVLLLGTFFVFETKFLRSGIGIFIASILIRPENIIYAFIFLGFLAAIRKLPLTSCAIGLCVAFGIYFAETRLSQNYGWSTLFYFTFIDWRILEGAPASSLGLSDYAHIYAKEVFRLVFSRGAAFPVFALAGFGALLLKFDRLQPWRDPCLQLVFLAAVYAAARTAALPGEPDRALAFPYMLIAIALIHACAFIKTSDKADLIQRYQ